MLPLSARVLRGEINFVITGGKMAFSKELHGEIRKVMMIALAIFMGESISQTWCWLDSFPHLGVLWKQRMQGCLTKEFYYLLDAKCIFSSFLPNSCNLFSNLKFIWRIIREYLIITFESMEKLILTFKFEVLILYARVFNQILKSTLWEWKLIFFSHFLSSS